MSVRSLFENGDSYGIRTRVTAVKGLSWLGRDGPDLEVPQ